LEQIGIVTKTNNGIATVQIKRSSACGDKCSSCNGCSTTSQTALVNNQIGANVGEAVKFELDDSKVLLAAFFVYILPLFSLIAGFIAFGVFYGVAFFVIPFIMLKFLDKKITSKFTGKITKIIDRI